MSEDMGRGPLTEYQIIWKNGHVETIRAHQVSHPNNGLMMSFSAEPKRRVIQFHGEFDGHWKLVLSADEDDISTIRNLTDTGNPL